MNEELFSIWQNWELRTGNTDSKLEVYSDGSGEFTERDLYGPKHAFDSLDQLAEILKP
jgi:hypothetical protein